jgi:hypothetical protein
MDGFSWAFDTIIPQFLIVFENGIMAADKTRYLPLVAMSIWIFGIERAGSTVHNGVQKIELQPRSRHNPDHVADEQHWLSAVSGPEINKSGLLETLNR